MHVSNVILPTCNPLPPIALSSSLSIPTNRRRPAIRIPVLCPSYIRSTGSPYALTPHSLARARTHLRAGGLHGKCTAGLTTVGEGFHPVGRRNVRETPCRGHQAPVSAHRGVAVPPSYPFSPYALCCFGCVALLSCPLRVILFYYGYCVFHVPYYAAARCAAKCGTCAFNCPSPLLSPLLSGHFYISTTVIPAYSAASSFNWPFLIPQACPIHFAVLLYLFPYMTAVLISSANSYPEADYPDTILANPAFWAAERSEVRWQGYHLFCPA